MSGLPLTGGEALAFNLAVNAVGSFAGAFVLSAVAARVFRVPQGSYRQMFLAMPLVKVVVDTARGVPEASFLWARLAGLEQEVGLLQVGMAFKAPLVPMVELALSADAAGRRYPQSVAEPLTTLLARRGWLGAAAWVPWGLGAVALGLLVVSAWRAWASRAAGDRARRAGRVVERRRLGRRTVDIVVSRGHDGVPFAGGVLRPYVCVSEPVFASLAADEREAVIEHELAHLARLDALVHAALTVVGDLGWFVPGLRAQCRAVAAQCEVAADARAVARGVDPAAMASALVRVAEISRAMPAHALSLVRPGPLLARRVQRLLDGEPTGRLGFGSRTGRALLTAWVAASVLASSVLGNH